MWCHLPPAYHGSRAYLRWSSFVVESMWQLNLDFKANLGWMLSNYVSHARNLYKASICSSMWPGIASELSSLTIVGYFIATSNLQIQLKSKGILKYVYVSFELYQQYSWGSRNSIPLLNNVMLVLSWSFMWHVMCHLMLSKVVKYSLVLSYH
jgi:hypothetical protein